MDFGRLKVEKRGVENRENKHDYRENPSSCHLPKDQTGTVGRIREIAVFGREADRSVDRANANREPAFSKRDTAPVCLFPTFITRNSGHCVRTGLDVVGAIYIDIHFKKFTF